MHFLLLVGVLACALVGCSDDKAGLSPAERAKGKGGMSEDIWKVYSGAESGVADDKDAKPDKGAQPKEKP